MSSWSWYLGKLFAFITFGNNRRQIKKIFYYSLYYNTNDFLRLESELQYNEIESALILEGYIDSFITKIEKQSRDQLGSKEVRCYFAYKSMLRNFKESVIDYEPLYNEFGQFLGEGPRINHNFIIEQIKYITNEKDKIKTKYKI